MIFQMWLPASSRAPQLSIPVRETPASGMVRVSVCCVLTLVASSAAHSWQPRRNQHKPRKQSPKCREFVHRVPLSQQGSLQTKRRRSTGKKTWVTPIAASNAQNKGTSTAPSSKSLQIAHVVPGARVRLNVMGGTFVQRLGLPHPRSKNFRSTYMSKNTSYTPSKYRKLLRPS